MTALLCQKGALLIQKEVFNTRKTSTVAQWLAAPSEHKGPVFDSTEKSPGSSILSVYIKNTVRM